MKIEGKIVKGYLPVLQALNEVSDPSGEAAVELFHHGSLSVKLYAPRGTDPQTPHTRDEIYVIASGRGRFLKGTEEVPFVPGDVLFVAAGEVHRFLDFSEDFATWVFFFGPEGGEAAA